MILNRFWEEKYCRRCFKSSFLFPIAIFFCLRAGMYKTSIIGLCVFFASLNHWRDARIGTWRRAIDQFFAHLLYVFAIITLKLCNSRTVSAF